MKMTIIKIEWAMNIRYLNCTELTIFFMKLLIIEYLNDSIKNLYDDLKKMSFAFLTIFHFEGTEFNFKSLLKISMFCDFVCFSNIHFLSISA